MRHILKAYYFLHDGVFTLFAKLDFVAPFLIRLYLAPIMLAAGLYKLQNFDATAMWLDQGLKLPYPEVMTYLVTYTELLGGFLLLLGLAVRWVSIPLMVAMLVAAFSVHWDNGWFAIAPSDPLTSTAKPLADIGIPMAQQSMDNSIAVGERLDRASSILANYGHYDWLSEKGNFVILNNGIEFAATYFILLLSLLFSGGGRYLSFDYYLDRNARQYIRSKRVEEKSEPVVEVKPSSAEAPAASREESPEPPSEELPEVAPEKQSEVDSAVPNKLQEKQAGTIAVE
ncbi:HvfX family Cu-binding RiPP maturation protein [Zhongshania aquimaris]|uniref:DoxX family protein n=1 Tax=Zhongshania aquimaris TaxID=2857107 RepID=A0ABS6VQF0_9GAMM|nr:DoxX family protein [Zhongshania aquimaris]MBW2940268.1 DoxX family protein [Zhongshania aquimaris]